MATTPLFYAHDMITTCRPCGHATTSTMYDDQPAAMPADYGTIQLAPKQPETCPCGAPVTRTELQAPAYMIAELKTHLQMAQ